MKTYEQHKVGLSPIYTKGIVMDDGVHIRPIIPTGSRTSLCIFNNTPVNLETAPARSTAHNEPLNQTELLTMFSNALVGSNHS